MLYKLMGASCIKGLVSVSKKLNISPQLAMIKGMSRKVLQQMNDEAIHQKIIMLAMPLDIMEGLQEAPVIKSMEPVIMEVEEKVLYLFAPMIKDEKYGVRIAQRNAVLEGRPKREQPISDVDEDKLKAMLKGDVDVSEMIKDL